MSDRISEAELNKMIKQASQKAGADPKKLEQAISSNSLESVLNNLKPEDADKLQKVLSDKAATERMLKSPQAQMLLKKFLENK